MVKKTLLVLLVFVGVILLMSVLSNNPKPTAQHVRPASTSNPPPPVALFPKRTEPQAASRWSYSASEDKMGRKQSTANVASTNTLEFGFPYQGVQHATLVTRKSAEWGTNVFVMIERGQFLCGFQGCTANVRFDSGTIQRFSASGTTDHSTTVLFLNNGARFISQLRKAKIVRIEPTFYHEGSQTLEFDAQGFKWQ
jgi:hypothetical protein